MEMKAVKPWVGRLLVKRRESKTETEGGLHIPEASRDILNCGEVIATGSSPDAAVWPPDIVDEQLKVGRTCYWKAYSGAELEIDGTSLIVLDFDDVLLTTEKS